MKIVLTEFGDEILYGEHEETIPLGRGDFENGCFVGQHNFCGGEISVQQISKTHNVIYCDKCNLRLSIPKKVDTYGKLRLWCIDEIMQAERRRRKKLLTGKSNE